MRTVLLSRLLKAATLEDGFADRGMRCMYVFSKCSSMSGMHFSSPSDKNDTWKIKSLEALNAE